MNRRGFLKFLGITPAVPIVGRAVAALPAVPAVAEAAIPAGLAAATLGTLVMYTSCSVLSLEPWDNIKWPHED